MRFSETWATAGAGSRRLGVTVPACVFRAQCSGGPRPRAPAPREARRSDAAIGVITTASFALGLALFALFGTTGQSFDAALFGSILGVRAVDLAAACGAAAARSSVTRSGPRAAIHPMAVRMFWSR